MEKCVLSMQCKEEKKEKTRALTGRMVAQLAKLY
jgi:hypothetical protein